MDSMRSLNSSLPRTTASTRAQQQNQAQPSEDLLSAFKAAALSVTTLYRSAASLEAPARAAGYQDALTDLLTFLDKENLGLGDGEGWSVRQWATERLDGSQLGTEHDEEDDEGAEDDQAEGPSADMTRKAPDEDLTSSVELPNNHARSEERELESPTLAQARLPARESQGSANTTDVKSTSAFTFRSDHTYPTGHDRDVSMDGQADRTLPAPGSNGGPAVARVESSIRPNRARQHRALQRPANSLRNTLGSGIGTKRKFPLGDFFDLSGISFDTKDGTDRGGKRGRHA